jgi:UDPglucose 6-dehydrogenase
MQRSREAIGIVGAGVVGGALRDYLHQRGADVRVFDPPKGETDMAPVNEAETIFVCVPTPYTAGRGFDDSHLLGAVARIAGSKTVVIKSTVLPGTTLLLQERYPTHRFIFNPEFLREATAYQDFVEPDRQIVGVTAASASEGERIMAMLPRAPFELICESGEAEMAKYVANAFLAVKVSYANEVFDLCERLHIDYAPVRDIVAADGRIGGSHMDVHDSGYRGYSGKCLPKDSKSLLDLARSIGVSMEVLRAADRVNAVLHPMAGGIPTAPRLRVAAAGENIEERAA